MRKITYVLLLFPILGLITLINITYDAHTLQDQEPNELKDTGILITDSKESTDEIDALLESYRYDGNLTNSNYNYFVDDKGETYKVEEPVEFLSGHLPNYVGVSSETLEDVPNFTGYIIGNYIYFDETKYSVRIDQDGSLYIIDNYRDKFTRIDDTSVITTEDVIVKDSGITSTILKDIVTNKDGEKLLFYKSKFYIPNTIYYQYYNITDDNEVNFNVLNIN